MDELAADWLALESRCPDELTYFQTFAWCRAWSARFATGGDTRPLIVTAWQGGELVAVWPLMVTRGGGLRQIRALGAPHTQYCGILLDPAHAGQALDRALSEAALRSGGCDVAVFDPVPSSSPLMAILAGRPRLAGYDNSSAILDLSVYPSADAYTAQLGKLQKRNRNRRRNHLARLGPLGFAVIWPGHPDFAELVRTCVAMKRRWLEETRRVSVGFAKQGYEDVLADLTGDEGSLTGACLSVLRAGERVVALELGFLRCNRYYAYIGGFDWDLADLSPGKVQMDMTVCWLIDRRVGAYDLLGNPTEYKLSWSNRTEGLRAFAVPFSLLGRLYVQAWLARLRPAIKRTYEGPVRRVAQKLATLVQGATCLAVCV